MTMPAIIIDTADIELDVPMSRDEAIQKTNDIRNNFNQARLDVLDMYQRKGYKAMGYSSFKEWAQREFKHGWQHAYTLKAAAEVDETLTPLFSPTGDPLTIPVNHAKQLRKLRSADAQVEAYQMSLDMAEAQGKDAPTEIMINNSVRKIQAKKAVSSSRHKVVKQMVAETTISITDGKQIIDELDKLDDRHAQAYVQKLMANYGLKNPDLIYPLGYKYITERKHGKPSYVLDEIDTTEGHLAGTPLSKATDKDLKRANEEAQKQHIAEELEKKRQKEEAERQRQLALHLEDPDNNPAPKPKPEQVAMTVWKHDSMKTLANLERELPEDDLDALLLLLAKRRGWIVTEAELTGDPGKKLPETGSLLDVYPFARNGLECHQADTIEMIIRVKPEEEDEV